MAILLRETLQQVVGAVLQFAAEQELPSGAGYLESLRTDKGEIEALFRELLIGVTQFFRDPQAFAGALSMCSTCMRRCTRRMRVA